MTDRWTAAFRLAATSAFAAACLIQVFLPNLLQARRWAGQEADAHVLDDALLNQTIANLTIGLDEAPPIGTVEAEGIPFLKVNFTHIFAYELLVVLCFLPLVLAGARHLWKERSPQAWIIAALLASTAAFMLVTRMVHTYFYPRFIVAALPCLVIAAVLGARRFPRGKGPVGAAASVLAGLLFTWLAWPAWVMLTTRPIAPLHDAASFVQSEAKKLDKPPLIACYGLGREVMPVYEPRSLPVEDAGGLEKIMQQAKAEQRSLFVIQGYNNFNRQLLPTGFKFLDDKALFTEVAAFPGIDPEFYFRVFRLVGSTGG